jgi:rare lipoprotein A
MVIKFVISIFKWLQHNHLFKKLAGQWLMLMLIVGCATESPIPPSSERAGLPSHNLRAKYNQPYQVKGKTYHPMLSADGYRQRGIASWYGAESGELTAMGAHFNPQNFTAAHKTLPLPCRVKVTNMDNGRSMIVVVNDRGPFHKGRLIDLSNAAAKRLGVSGIANVEVEYLDEYAGGV